MYFMISMVPAVVSSRFSLGASGGHAGWSWRAPWGAGVHHRGQKCFHTLSDYGTTLNVGSVSVIPLAIYSH